MEQWSNNLWRTCSICCPNMPWGNVSLQFKPMGIEYNHWHMRYALRGKRGTNDRNTNIMICWHNSGFRKSNAAFAWKCITKKAIEYWGLKPNIISGLEERKSCLGWWCHFFQSVKITFKIQRQVNRKWTNYTVQQRFSNFKKKTPWLNNKQILSNLETFFFYHKFGVKWQTAF